MPLYVRRLPGTPKKIIDAETQHPNEVLFNPSFADPYMYLRVSKLSPTNDKNHAILYNCKTQTTTFIETPWERMAPTVNLFQGIEDLRICWYNDHLWFAGTTTHITKEMTNELIVGYFNKEVTEVEQISAVDIGSLPVKNVCPFVANGKLLLLDIFKQSIYEIREEQVNDNISQFFATTVRKLVPGSKICIDEFRGSTSPIHLHGNTWGCVIHDIIFNDNLKLVTRLSYIHHWMEFDVETGSITFLSSPFWIAHWGIEYVSGIQYNKETGEINLFLGVNDRMPIAFSTTLHNLRIGK